MQYFPRLFALPLIFSIGACATSTSSKPAQTTMAEQIDKPAIPQATTVEQNELALEAANDKADKAKEHIQPAKLQTAPKAKVSKSQAIDFVRPNPDNYLDRPLAESQKERHRRLLRRNILGRVSATIEVSSFDPRERFKPKNLTDKLISRGWCSVPEDLTSAFVEIRFNEAEQIDRLDLMPGIADKNFGERERLAVFRLLIDGVDQGEFRLADKQLFQGLTIDQKVKKIRVEAVATTGGELDQDRVCIAEIIASSALRKKRRNAKTEFLINGISLEEQQLGQVHLKQYIAGEWDVSRLTTPTKVHESFTHIVDSLAPHCLPNSLPAIRRDATSIRIRSESILARMQEKLSACRAQSNSACEDFSDFRSESESLHRDVEKLSDDLDTFAIACATHIDPAAPQKTEDRLEETFALTVDLTQRFAELVRLGPKTKKRQ